MKSFSKRLIAAALCALIPAADVIGTAGILPDFLKTDTFITTASAAEQDPESIFDDSAHSTTIVTNNASVRAGDPYGTGDGTWKNVITVPEVFGVYTGTNWGASLHDVNDNSKKKYQATTPVCWDSPAAVTGMDIGNGKDDTVASASYADGEFNICILDPTTGTGKTDNDFTYTRIYNTASGISETSTTHLLETQLSGALVSGSFNYLKDVNSNVNGMFLSIAAGDFNGNGKDSIITYVPSWDSPSIQEYDVVYADASKSSRLNYDYGYVGSAAATGHYYTPVFNKKIVVNVYSSFGLQTSTQTGNEERQRDIPLVDLVAEDIDKDGRDELIVTAGLGGTTCTGNASTTKMRIYDYYNGEFHETYTLELTGNYFNYDGRVRYASSAVGDVDVNVTASGVNFPEIVTAGWVDKNSGTNTESALDYIYGMHITKIKSVKKENDGSYTGDYSVTEAEKLTRTYSTTWESIDLSGGNNLDGISVYMKNGFHPYGRKAWKHHNKLAVGVISALGPAENSQIVLGNTVYSINESNKLEAQYICTYGGLTKYSIQKVLTGRYNGTKDGAYFLYADENNKFYTTYCWYDGNNWAQENGMIEQDSAGTYAASICNVDTDNDGLRIKLNEVTMEWSEVKPLFILEAAPYFDELHNGKYENNGNTGETSISKAYSEGSSANYSAGISASLEIGVEGEIDLLFTKLASGEAGSVLESSLTYSGATSVERELSITYTNDSGDNAVVVTRIPHYIYKYDVDGKSDHMYLGKYGDPQTAGISVEKYNEYANNFNKGKTADKKILVINKDNPLINLCTPGDPYSYRKTFPAGNNSAAIDDMNFAVKAISDDDNQLDITLPGYQSSISGTKEVTYSKSAENGLDIELGNSVFIGGTVTGVKTKTTIGLSASSGFCIFHTNSVSRSGKGGNYYNEIFPYNKYNFDWDFGFWDIEATGVGDKKFISVLGYTVNNVVSPTVSPREFGLDNYVGNTATFSWELPEIPVSRKGVSSYVLRLTDSLKKTTTIPFTLDQVTDANGRYFYSLNCKDLNLKDDENYTCTLSCVTAGNNWESVPTEGVSLRINNYYHVNITHGKGLTLQQSGGEESQETNNTINTVYYSVNDGYEVPANYYGYTQNGISVQVNNNVISVLGTPTNDTNITIPDMALKNYTISYDLDGGTLKNRVTSYNVETETIALPTPIKDGYMFAGWTGSNGNAITEIKKGSTGNISLQANWINLAYFGYTENYPADGSQQYPFIISSTKGWNFFCELLEDNSKGFFTDKIIKLGSDITVAEMAGESLHDFTGTFDGSGKTLTFSYTADENYTAPFRYVQGSETSHAVIKNLNVVSTVTGSNYRHCAGLIALQTGYVDVINCNVEAHISQITTGSDKSLYPSALVSQASATENGTLFVNGCKVTGDITTNGKYAAGYVGIVQGTATIENSISSITINSSVDVDGNKDGTHSGFIASHSSKKPINIRGCVFNGKLLTDNGTIKCAGFIGWRNSTANIYDSIFDPAEVTVGNDGSATFARNMVDTFNCYYTYLLNDGKNYTPGSANDADNPDRWHNGKQAYTITAGENVTIDYGTPVSEYDISGITAYETGLAYNGKFYAANEENVSLTLDNTPPQGYELKEYTVNAGTLADGTLTMPAENVTISAEFQEDISFVNNSTISSDTITAGDTLTINGAAEGGTAPYTYSYYYKKSSVNNWNTKLADTTKTAASLKLGTAVPYEVKVVVKDSSGNTREKIFTVNVEQALPLVNNSAAPETVMIGEAITVTGAAQGGIAPYTYSYYYKKSSVNNWNKKLENSTKTTTSFKPGAAVPYDVKVVVKDSKGNTQEKVFTVNVQSQPLVNNSTVPEAIMIGEAITITGAAEGGIAPYTYSYYYKKSSSENWNKKLEDTDKTSTSFKPGAAVPYDVKVVVKDSKGNTEEKILTVDVQAQPLVNNSTAPETITIGEAITITGAAEGGAAPYTYSYYYKKSSISGWNKKLENSDKTSTSFKPGAAVPYDVKVVVKDSRGNTQEKVFTVNVQSQPLVNNSTAPETITIGEAITITGAAQGGTAPYTYSYYYKKSSANNWNKKLEDTDKTSTSFKPGAAVPYDVKVVVKDNVGNTEEQIFTIEVTN